MSRQAVLYAKTAVLALVCGLTALALTALAAAAITRSLSCYELGHRWGVATTWNPIQGCTVDFLGARVVVGP